MSGKTTKIVSCNVDGSGKLVPISSILTVTDDEGTESSTPSKTKSTTKNTYARDIPLLADSAVNHPSEQFNPEGAKGNDGVIPPPPTGNINSGPGAGAYNLGKRAASVIVRGGDVSFKSTEDASGDSVPSEGNFNSGLGSGGTNYGEEAATVQIEGGTVSLPW